MRFSCSDYTFPLLKRDRRFALVKLLGFTHVDLGLFERTPDLAPSRLLAKPKVFIAQLQRDLTSASLKVADVFLQTGADPVISAANDPDAAVRAQNRRLFALAVEVCAGAGCRHLTGLPGVFHACADRPSDFSLAADEAAWRCEKAAEAGITYAVEAHIGSICPDIASTRALLRAVRGLTLTLDYTHFVMAGVRSGDIHSLLGFASHIHVRGGAPGRLQTPVSENMVDYAGMARRLQRQGYSGFLALEYVYTEWQQCNRTDNITETLLLRKLLEHSLKAPAKGSTA
jgi:sugar phosphate isomerase/epimerase